MARDIPETEINPARGTRFNSRGRLSELVRDEVLRHRLDELTGAVREHQRRVEAQGLGQRAHDRALYRRSRLIVGRGGNQSKAA